MNAEQFCLQYANETLSGRITFRKETVKKFLTTYTYLKFEDLSKDQIEKLKFTMIELYGRGFDYTNINDQPAEKIDLPTFMFK